jgi:release factor glutamine methyltransferase
MKTSIAHIRNSLEAFYSDAEIQSITYILLEKITDFSFPEILINKSKQLSEKQRETLEIFLEKLKNFEPLQYVVGEAEFFGMRFSVNRDVLIPRPETEELVEWILENHTKTQNISILDIGTGSGCIAIALKKHLPDAQVFALDISENALKVAKRNAEKNNVEINFLKQDIFKFQISNFKFDLIVSNPPYIPENEKNTISENVLNYEPHTALFVPDNSPLIFYEKIIAFAKENLAENGAVYFETHYNKARDIADLFAQNGFTTTEIRKDLAGKERMVKMLS